MASPYLNRNPVLITKIEVEAYGLPSSGVLTHLSTALEACTDRRVSYEVPLFLQFELPSFKNAVYAGILRDALHFVIITL